MATVAPPQTVVIIEQTLQPIDRCGARIKDRPGEFCNAAPVAGRRRCRLHGGLTPVGRDSPHFISGRHSRYPVPLTSGEQLRYQNYRTAVYDERRQDLADDLALSRVVYERAISAGSSGVAEAGAVARLAGTHARITSGRVIRLAVDEVAFDRLTERWMDVVERHVLAALGPDDGKRLLAEIAIDLRNSATRVEEPAHSGS